MEVTKAASSVIKAMILLIFLGLTVTIYNITQPSRDALKDTSTQIALAHEMSRYAPYDSVAVSGSNIRSAVKAFAMDDRFFVYINHPSGLFVLNPSELNTTAPAIDVTASKATTSTVPVNTTLAQISDESSGRYIRPQSKWTASLVIDRRGEVSGILFK